jgi:hypothetical protein
MSQGDSARKSGKANEPRRFSEEEWEGEQAKDIRCVRAGRLRTVTAEE